MEINKIHIFMKLKSYFLLSIVVGMAFACSSDENVPEVEVFTPDATLSLAAVADGKSLTKAGEGEKENIDQEDAIKSLHVKMPGPRFPRSVQCFASFSACLHRPD